MFPLAQPKYSSRNGAVDGFLYFWDMDIKNEFELVVSDGKLPIWKAVLAAAFFTLMFYNLYDVVTTLYLTGFESKISKSISRSMEGFGFCLAGGVMFATRKVMMIDLDRDKLISRYLLGPFSRDRLTVIPELEYVSVFYDSKENFQVNLWYKGNKHFKMCRFAEKSPAMEFARHVAKKLKIDLLDATVKGNSQWLDLLTD